MKFAAFGRTQLLYEAIRAAVAAGHEAVLIGTSPAAPEYSRNEQDFERLAAELGCPFFCDAAINRSQYVAMARASKALVAVGLNWPTLVGPDMLGAFKWGVLNSHAGPLPRFRGNACPNWAILHQEAEIVLTLHQMALALDAGPILLQRAMPLTPETYIGEIYRFMEREVPGMVVEALNGLQAGRLTFRAQDADPANSLRCFPRQPVDSRLDWTLSAGRLALIVRAGAEPFSGAYTYLEGRRLVVWRARAEDLPYPVLGVPGQVIERRAETGELCVLCGEGVLVLEAAELETGGRRSAAELVRSTRTRLGLDPTEMIERLERRLEELERRLLHEPPTSGDVRAESECP